MQATFLVALLLAPAAAFTAGRAPPRRAVAAPSGARSSGPQMATERTYIMIKPDGVQRGLVGKIIERFETRGYHLQGLKLFQASEELLKTHYCDLVEKPFFPGLLEYMLSGPVTWCATPPIH